MGPIGLAELEERRVVGLRRLAWRDDRDGRRHPGGALGGRRGDVDATPVALNTNAVSAMRGTTWYSQLTTDGLPPAGGSRCGIPRRTCTTRTSEDALGTDRRHPGGALGGRRGDVERAGGAQHERWQPMQAFDDLFPQLTTDGAGDLGRGVGFRRLARRHDRHRPRHSRLSLHRRWRDLDRVGAAQHQRRD